MTARSTFRWRQLRHFKKARWAALAVALPALWACNSRQLEQPTAKPTRIFNNTFQETVNRDIDIVFVIDTSQSMAPLQAKLLANFPVFMQVLSNLPNGLPNVHIGVISTNMGSGGYEVPNCPLGGDQGRFQAAPRGTCTASGLMPGQNFISNINGQANYTGTIENVFTCIAALGDQGCGFEAQFGSTVRALGADGFAPPPENEGFLRPNAFLSIIMITNEDDCSVPRDSDLFDPNSRLVTDPLGPLSSFRCNEYGHLCNGMPPSRTAMSYPPASCVSAEDGRLLRVSDTIAQVKGLKPNDPSKVLVAVVGGIPDRYDVTLVAPMVRDDPNMWPAIAHSCPNMPVDEYADPGVRLAAFVQAFGRNGVYQTICADSFAPALQRIAEEIGKVLGPKCVEGTIVQKDGRPDCTVLDRTSDANGAIVETPVEACADNGNTAPCWALAQDAMNCPGSQVLAVNRMAGTTQSQLDSVISCSICIPGVRDAMGNPLPGCP